MPRPTEIKLHQKTRVLEVHFDDGFTCNLPCEYLRVYSPSAEVQGHGPGQAVLQIGKEDVNITGIEQVGNYAIKIRYDDHHDTGIYSWSYLYRLGQDYQQNWADYLRRLREAGVSRRAD